MTLHAMHMAYLHACSAPLLMLQDEVEIVHQEGDETQRQADVQDKIIRQVDQLVAYFNGLFQDDQLDIRWGACRAALE